MNDADQYLKAIYLLQQASDGPVATGMIADSLDVHPSSATEMVRKLEDGNLLDYEKYVGVTLTDPGIDRARAALETYCILEYFLSSVLDVDAFRGEAKQLQSVIDETVADRLDTIIDRPGECPDCFSLDEDRCAFLDPDDE
ncbi:MAG: metal-dependent transcriptional regulator [Haloferacaceae archaeon]